MLQRVISVSVASLVAASGAVAQCQIEWDRDPGTPGVSSGYMLGMAVWDDGQGEKLFAGGSFANVSGTGARYAAAWNPATGLWEQLGSQIPASFVQHIRRFNPGDGEKLVITGVNWQNVAGLPGTRGIVMWDGQNFVSTNAPWTTGGVYDVTPWHNGTAEVLVAGGNFTFAGLSDRIAVWDSQQWTSIGAGFTGTVFRLQVFNGDLYASGAFTSPVAYLAHWDGASWQPVGGGVAGTGSIQTLFVGDDGNGEALFAGGRRFSAGGHPHRHVNRWDGQTWTPVGQDLTAVGTTGEVRTLALFDVGDGLKLYAGARNSDFNPMGYLIRLENDMWVSNPYGLPDNNVHGLLVWGDKMYIAGTFDHIAGIPTSGMVALKGCPSGPQPCYANCDNSTTEPVLNVEDFVCFVNEFAAGLGLPPAQQITHYANCDNSTTEPVLNVEDFICFISEFSQGCP
jgi:trimeric autotransporter adhesin